MRGCCRGLAKVSVIKTAHETWSHLCNITDFYVIVKYTFNIVDEHQ